MDQAATGAIRLTNISCTFGHVRAVDNVSLDVAPGEFLSLLGPSGSGKTTTLMMIAGFQQPDSGDIALDEQPIVGVPSYKRGFGMVFQNYALFPHMTVGANIGFPLRMRGVSGQARSDAVGRALELVRLAGYQDRLPHQLSGGQQQRVALARALVFNPPVLLMDEPLGALDKKLREEMQLEIMRIQRELGITTISVTHDQAETLVMSDRVAVMRDGHIEQVADPHILYERPTSRFVADFIGESNVLAIRRDTDGRYRTEDGIVLTAVQVEEQDTSGWIVVRPEKVRLSAEPVDPTSLPATVEEVVYGGDVDRYRLRLGPSSIVVAKQQRRVGEVPYDAGASVHLHWDSRDCVFLRS